MFRSKDKDILFVLLLELAALLKKGSNEIRELKVDGTENLRAIWKDTEKNKEEAQAILTKVMKALDNSLITPIEREDILHLAERLTSAISSLESCAARFDLYEMNTLTEDMITFTEFISDSGDLIHETILKLTDKKFQEMNPGIQKIYANTEAFHKLERKAIKSLFKNYTHDPVTLIKYKELYDFIVRVTIKQEKIAKVLGTIIMKNA